MRSQADLFFDYDASASSIHAKGPEPITADAKPRNKLLKAMDYEAAAQMLEASGDYRVLRRLRPRPVTVPRMPSKGEKIAVVVDTETTGLDSSKDEVIELGMVAFTYSESGRVGDVIDMFSALREPSVPISPEITRLTGITLEMVAGQRFDIEAVERFIDGADLIIAHNAGFDRPFCECLSPSFQVKAWACSHSEISWSDFGCEGSKLGYLVNRCGWFHQGHRAVEDCYALLEVLTASLSQDGILPFSQLLASAQKTRMRIWAESSPFDMKDVLKKRGYRWNDGIDGRPKSWWVEIDEESYRAELTFLRQEVYRRDVEPYVQRVTAFERFRAAR
jgi:DNA polymerase-3 subunit epsilon